MSERKKKEDMVKEYGLLSDSQVFGMQQTALITAIGTEAKATDFARLCSDSSAKWFLSSPAGYGDVVVVGADGQRGVAYASSQGGIRPILPCNDLLEISDDLIKDISGFTEVAFGEYPQQVVDRTLARSLESDRSAGRLRKTGKVFLDKYEEYVWDDRKFIRTRFLSIEPTALSNGRTYEKGDTVWVEVLPVKWLYDEEAGFMLARQILASGVTFSEENYYDGDFKNTDAWVFLNEAFAKDIVPSRLRDMTEEEKAAYEEEIQRAARRRNPYGLQFGKVTEEDIIRGAIESDVAVFLHGPSSEGKSARVKQIDPTCEIIYLRNATPDSLNGRSVYNQATGEMIDIPPTWYKKVVAKCEKEPDKFHVVFFDEINNALPSIQGMAFNIVLDREVNGLWKLPDNARVVAAGNDMADSLAANQIAAPFFNRFAHVYINTTTEKWLAWAKKNHIHPAIYSYIAYKKGETLRSKYDGERPNADPRKWEMASKMLYATGRPEMLRALIGEDITDEFVQFCNQPVITLRNVLQGNYTMAEIESLNTAEKYATTMGLLQAGEEDVETVQAFVDKLGAEFRAIFDSLWVK